jgi:four helix bundle protein
MAIQSHRDLVVWSKSMDLAESIYGLARAYPRAELYGLRSQITRAAASVPANIAEGHARGSRQEFRYFLSVARGSLMETDTFLRLSERLDFIKVDDSQQAHSLITEVSKMLTSLRTKLRPDSG